MTTHKELPIKPSVEPGPKLCLSLPDAKDYEPGNYWVAGRAWVRMKGHIFQVDEPYLSIQKADYPWEEKIEVQQSNSGFYAGATVGFCATMVLLALVFWIERDGSFRKKQRP